MTSNQIDRFGRLDSSVAVKAPVRAATTGADIGALLTPAGLGTGGGLITIDGIALTAGDRVLVKDQADARQNGIYVASVSPWQRDADFASNAAVTQGTFFLVTQGATNGGLLYELTTASPISIGATALAFAVIGNPTVSSAMAPVAAAATLAAARTAMGVGTAATQNTGTSGGNVPLLNSANTWSGAQSLSGAALNEALVATVASAATVDLGALAGNHVHITGTTTITSFGTTGPVGARRKFVFDGALTLTNSANLILPGGANLTTAASDCGEAVCESVTGSGVWRVENYFRGPASSATAFAGTDTIAFLTAAALAGIFTRSGANHLYKFPGGNIVQFYTSSQSCTSNSTTIVTHPTAFPNTTDGAIVGPNVAPTTGTGMFGVSGEAAANITVPNLSGTTFTPFVIAWGH